MFRIPNYPSARKQQLTAKILLSCQAVDSFVVDISFSPSFLPLKPGYHPIVVSVSQDYPCCYMNAHLVNADWFLCWETGKKMTWKE